MTLTNKQKTALGMVREHGIGYVGEDVKIGIMTSGPTSLIDGQPWINWRTAEALERKGFGKCQGWGEEAEFVLAEASP
jgi:hypothetical protein